LFNSAAVDSSGHVYAAGTQYGNEPYTYAPAVSATGTYSNENVVLVKYGPLFIHFVGRERILHMDWCGSSDTPPSTPPFSLPHTAPLPAFTLVPYFLVVGLIPFTKASTTNSHLTSYHHLARV